MNLTYLSSCIVSVFHIISLPQVHIIVYPWPTSSLCFQGGYGVSKSKKGCNHFEICDLTRHSVDEFWLRSFQYTKESEKGLLDIYGWMLCPNLIYWGRLLCYMQQKRLTPHNMSWKSTGNPVLMELLMYLLKHKKDYKRWGKSLSKFSFI